VQILSQEAIFLRFRKKLRSILAGVAAGVINGLFGAGGGMVLVPLLGSGGEFTQEELFSSSIVIILPICVISLIFSADGSLPWVEAWPFLIGSIPGGLLAGFFGRRIPTIWLHRFLGVLILYGGVRYLC
jgi:uncharacterized membrane protein YfcA